MNNRTIEFLVGCFVLAGLAAVFYLALQVGSASLFSKDSYELHDDTIASVKTAGLIGDRFIELSPGGSGFALEAGDMIVDTESALDIENLISKFALGGMDKEEE